MNCEIPEVAPYAECISVGNKFMRLCWGVFSLLFFRPFAGPLFRQYRLWVLRLWGAEIGACCAVSASARIYQPWKLHLKAYVAIGERVRLYNCADIYAGSKCVISQYAYLCTASHDISSKSNRLISAPIHIGSFAWVASDAFVGMGVTIGEGAVVGARACVFKDVDPWTVVGGNPAMFIKKRELKNG